MSYKTIGGIQMMWWHGSNGNTVPIKMEQMIYVLKRRFLERNKSLIRVLWNSNCWSPSSYQTIFWSYLNWFKDTQICSWKVRRYNLLCMNNSFKVELTRIIRYLVRSMSDYIGNHIFKTQNTLCWFWNWV